MFTSAVEVIIIFCDVFFPVSYASSEERDLFQFGGGVHINCFGGNGATLSNCILTPTFLCLLNARVVCLKGMFFMLPSLNT